jgi:hypothetical protein
LRRSTTPSDTAYPKYHPEQSSATELLIDVAHGIRIQFDSMNIFIAKVGEIFNHCPLPQTAIKMLIALSERCFRDRLTESSAVHIYSSASNSYGFHVNSTLFFKLPPTCCP